MPAESHVLPVHKLSEYEILLGTNWIVQPSTSRARSLKDEMFLRYK